MDLSDIGNARAFARQARDSLLWMPQDKRWWSYDASAGTWSPDLSCVAMATAIKTAEALAALAERQSDTPTETPQPDGSVKTGPSRRVHARRWAARSRSSDRLAAMIKWARAEPKMHAVYEDFDRDDYKLSVQGGQLVDLRTGKARATEPRDRVTKQAGAPWLPLAECRRWERFLREVAPPIPDKPDPPAPNATRATVDAYAADLQAVERARADQRQWIDYIQRAVGASLIGAQRDALLLFLHGRGSNGKTTFLETVADVLGSYAVQTMPDLLMVTRNERHTSELVDLMGARMAISTETKQRGVFDEGKIKRMTGGGKITGARKSKDSVTFRAKFTMWVDGNSDPRVSGQDDGIWRRIKKLPWLAHFRGSDDPRQEHSHDKDPHLLATLQAEHAGILRWAIAGARLYLSDGLTAPQVVIDATTDYKATQDELQHMLDTVAVELSAGRVETRELYEALVAAYESEGYKPPTARTLYAQLRDKGYALKPSNAKRFWHGLQLKPATDRPARAVYS